MKIYIPEMPEVPLGRLVSVFKLPMKNRHGRASLEDFRSAVCTMVRALLYGTFCFVLCCYFIVYSTVQYSK